MEHILSKNNLSFNIYIYICFAHLQAFAEMQLNKVGTTHKMNVINMKCDMVRNGKQKYQLTERCTNDLTDDTR